MFKEGNIIKAIANWSLARIFFTGNLFFILGALLGEIFIWPGFILIIVGWLLLFCLVVFYTQPIKFRWSILFVFLFLGCVRQQSVNPDFLDQSKIFFYNGQTVIVSGIVCWEPDERIDQVKITVCVDQLLSPRRQKISGKILVKLPLYANFSYGDKVEIIGKLYSPKTLGQTSQDNFDYAKYLSKDGIYSLAFAPEISKLADKEGSPLLAKIFQLKFWLLNLLQKILPEPQASFLAGLLLGARQGIAPKLMADFSRSGVTHILAISGYNITLVVIFLSQLGYFCYLSRRQVFYFVSFSLLIFTIITGASASVVRAAIMGWLILLAQSRGRLGKIHYILAFTAALMVWQNPKIILWDAGWQLSFAATMGLVYLSPLLKIVLQKLPERFGLKENFCSTAAATILTLPLSLYNFGQLPLYSLVVNLLILPAVPYAMAAGSAALLIGLLSVKMGLWVAAAVWLILSYIIKIVEFFSALPGAVYSWQISWPILCLGYGLIILIIILANYQLKIKDNHDY